jgi:hypothetical protein
LSDSSTTNNVNIVSKEEWPQSMAADASFSVDSVEDQQHALLKEHTTSPILPTLNSKELSALDLSPPLPPSSKAPLITATHALVKAPSSTLASNHDDNSIHDDSITSVSSFNSSSRSDIGIGSGTSLLHHAATLDDENFDKHFIFEKNHDPLDDAAAAADGSEKLLHERQQDEQQNDPCPSCSMYHAGDLNDVTLLPLVLILCVVALLLVLKKKTMLLQQEEADKSQSHDCYERTVGDYYSGDSSDTSSLTSFSSLSCSSVSAEMVTISTSDVALLQLSKPTPPAATKTRRAAARRRYAHAGVHHHPSLSQSQSQRPCRDKPIIIMLDEDAKDSIEDCDYDNDGYNHIKVF